MSIVLAIATNDRVIVKSDGREKDGNTQQIISEDLRKFDKVCPNCIIGYTGVKHVGQQIIDEIRRIIPDNNNIEPESIIQLIQGFCKNNLKECYTCAFIVAGISYKLNKPIIYGVSYTDNFSNIITSFYENKIPGSIFIGSKYISSEKFKVNPSFSLENNMNEYIRKISRMDDSVNDHISTIKLRMR